MCTGCWSRPALRAWRRANRAGDRRHPKHALGEPHILSRAGLVTAQRAGRSIIYRAAYDQMRELLGFLMEDCCAGKPEICAPLMTLASQPCSAEGRTC
jgi:DNA-binding transcriptional ArsR family regulator